MNVLLVDDEPAVLASIRRLLSHLAPKTWQVLCAESGEAALGLLAERPFDVIVSDMRMPRMDGAQFLELAAAQWPDVTRIVLSGQSDEATSMRAVAVAHQCLSKPYPTKELLSLLMRIGTLRSSCDNPAVRAVVGAAKRLPVMPAVYEELNELLRIPDVDPTRFISLIGRNAGLCAKVLQLANSSFFFLGRRVTDVGDAVQRLGSRVIANVALIDGLMSSFHYPDRFGFAHEATRFFEASLLADSLVSESQRSDASLATLLCPIGKLLLINEMPERLAEAVALAERERISLEEAETQVIGASHAAIGGYLLALWGLPAPVAEAVASHHQPSTCPIQGDVLAAAHLASHHIEGTVLERDLLARLGLMELGARWASAM
jgi:HD-like signal output (HDOD) protein